MSRYRGSERFCRYTIPPLIKRKFKPGVDGEGTVLPTPAGFTGYEYINTTGIVVNDFEIVETPNAVPKQLICKVRPGDISIAGGRTLTSNAVDLFTDLELQFVVTKANGDPVPDYFGLLHPITSGAFNLFTDTKEGNYHSFLPIHEPDGYQVTLYARGKNGANIRVNSLTKPVTTGANTRQTLYANSVGGDNTYDGLAPRRITGTATFTNATKRLVGTGIATGYDHAAATADACPFFWYNDVYLTGATEVGFPVGRYKVAAKISDNELELADALGADYTNVTFSTGPKASPITLTDRNWYISGEWQTASEISWLDNTNVIGYDGGFRLTSSGTAANVMGGGGGTSAGTVADQLFFMANGVVDGEFINNVVGRSLSSTKTGVIKTCLYNMEFKGDVSGSTIDIGYTRPPADWVRHYTFIKCKFNGLVNDRYELTSAGNASGVTLFVPQETIDPSTPATGFLWFVDSNGRNEGNRKAYTSWDVNGFVLSSATTSSCPAGNYVIATGSITHSYNTNIKCGNPDWSLGIIFSEFQSDCLDDIKDHDLYPNGYLDNLHVSYNKFGKGMGASYAVNGNLSSAVLNKEHYNISFCDNLLTEHRRFGFDLSITNASAPIEKAYGVLVRGNSSGVMHCLSYYNAARAVRFAHNIHLDVRNLGNSSDLWAAFVRAGSEAVSSEFTAVIDNNDVRGSKLMIYNQDEVALEVLDNINSFSFDGECINIDSSGYTGGAITGNNLYNPGQPSGHVAQVDGAGKTLAEFNALVDGVNISEDPGGITQFSYDFSAETLGTGLPSFVRLASGSNAVTSSIVSTTLSSGAAGQAWKVHPAVNGSTILIILSEIVKQTGDISMFAIVKGEVGGTNAIITRLASRIYEVDGAQPFGAIASGHRPSSSEIKIRNLGSGATAMNVAATGPNETTFFANWRKVLLKHSSTGLIELYEWDAAGTKPATPNLTFDDTAANSLANAFVGLAGANDGRVFWEYISVGINGSPAVEI